ncbi:MAG TPA: hypothetical protein PLN40_15440, partial [Agitococcus sp.]|nr:hypothetical protein [Agitococcus sp.]HNA22799.1 hypothetical protein [Agitococcus sp.]
MTKQQQNDTTPQEHTDHFSSYIQHRLARLQAQNMINQFQFFSFIAIISVITISALYWKEDNTRFLDTQSWLVFSLFIIGGCIGLIQSLKNNFKEISNTRIEKTINFSAALMGSVWGLAAMVFSPSLPDGHSNLVDFYRPALLACLVSWQAIAALTAYSSRFETFIYFSLAAIMPGLF